MPNVVTTSTGQAATVSRGAVRLERLRQFRRALIAMLRQVEGEIAEAEQDADDTGEVRGPYGV